MEIFKASKLESEKLASVWDWSDLNRDGRLSRDEWVVACHLLRHLKYGQLLQLFETLSFVTYLKNVQLLYIYIPVSEKCSFFVNIWKTVSCYTSEKCSVVICLKNRWLFKYLKNGQFRSKVLKRIICFTGKYIVDTIYCVKIPWY